MPAGAPAPDLAARQVRFNRGSRKVLAYGALVLCTLDSIGSWVLLVQSVIFSLSMPGQLCWECSMPCRDIALTHGSGGGRADTRQVAHSCGGGGGCGSRGVSPARCRHPCPGGRRGPGQWRGACHAYGAALQMPSPFPTYIHHRVCLGSTMASIGTESELNASENNNYCIMLNSSGRACNVARFAAFRGCHFRQMAWGTVARKTSQHQDLHSPCRLCARGVGAGGGTGGGAHGGGGGGGAGCPPAQAQGRHGRRKGHTSCGAAHGAQPPCLRCVSSAE